MKEETKKRIKNEIFGFLDYLFDFDSRVIINLAMFAFLMVFSGLYGVLKADFDSGIITRTNSFIMLIFLFLIFKTVFFDFKGFLSLSGVFLILIIIKQSFEYLPILGIIVGFLSILGITYQIIKNVDLKKSSKIVKKK